MEEKKEILQYRNHISYIIENAWTIFLVLLAAILGNSEMWPDILNFLQKKELTEKAQNGVFLFLAAIAFFVVLLLWNLNRWYRTVFTIQDGTVSYAKKTLTRKVNTMSVKQISNVNLEQNLFEMILGTCKVRLDTDSLSTADVTDMQIILKKKDAEYVKQLILSMKEGTDMKQQEEKEKQYDVEYSFGETIINGLLSISLTQVVMAVIFLVSLSITLGMMIEEHESLVVMISALLAEFIAAFSFIWAIIKKILQDFRFRIRREGDRLCVSSGLWKRKDYLVPVGKIHAVKIEYPVLGRIFGRGFIRIINVGGEGEEADGMKLSLLGRYDDLEKKMEILLPEFVLPKKEMLKKAPKTWILIREVYGILLASISYVGAMCGICYGLELDWGARECLLGAGLSSLTTFVLWSIISLFTYFAMGLGYTSDNLLVSRGVFGKKIIIIPYNGIQYICFNQGPVERLFHIKHGYVSLLASVLSRYQPMGSFLEKDFDQLECELKKTY